MTKKLQKVIFIIITISLFIGCGGNKVDVLSYPKKIKDKVDISDICKEQYLNSLPTVAVMNFKNNSNFSNKLSSSVTAPLESLIVDLGVAKIFTREDMERIDAELKFQDSGLLDPNTTVEFGKLSGVRYIITGSIDSVDQKFRGNSAIGYAIHRATRKSDNDAVKVLGSLVGLGTVITDGMIVSVKLTVQMLDVQTGKILFSKSIGGSTNIGKISRPTYEQTSGAISKIMIEELPKIKDQFSKNFAPKGYITQIKSSGKKVIVQVNMGKDLKVVENQIFKVFTFEDLEDPITGAKSCDIIEVPITLRASQQIQDKTTWTTVHSGDGRLLMLGQLVEKSNKKAGFEIPKF